MCVRVCGWVGVGVYETCGLKKGNSGVFEINLKCIQLFKQNQI